MLQTPPKCLLTSTGTADTHLTCMHKKTENSPTTDIYFSPVFVCLKQRKVPNSNLQLSSAGNEENNDVVGLLLINLQIYRNFSNLVIVE